MLKKLKKKVGFLGAKEPKPPEQPSQQQQRRDTQALALRSARGAPSEKRLAINPTIKPLRVPTDTYGVTRTTSLKTARGRPAAASLTTPRQGPTTLADPRAAAALNQVEESPRAEDAPRDVGDELSRLHLTAEQESALSATAREALRHALGEAPSPVPAPDKPFVLDLGRELLQVELTDDQSSHLSSRGRDALIAARVQLARESNREVTPGSSQSLGGREEAAPPPPAMKLHLGSLQGGGAPLQSARGPRPAEPLAEPLQSARGAPLRSARGAPLTSARGGAPLTSARLSTRGGAPPLASARGYRADAAEYERWMELGVALASARLSPEDELKLTARGREALSDARALAASPEAPLGEADESRWIGFGLELDSAKLTGVEEEGLSAFARDALTAARAIKTRHYGNETPRGEVLPPTSKPWQGARLSVASVMSCDSSVGSENATPRGEALPPSAKPWQGARLSVEAAMEAASSYGAGPENATPRGEQALPAARPRGRLSVVAAMEAAEAASSYGAGPENATPRGEQMLPAARPRGRLSVVAAMEESSDTGVGAANATPRGEQALPAARPRGRLVVEQALASTDTGGAESLPGEAVPVASKPWQGAKLSVAAASDAVGHDSPSEAAATSTPSRPWHDATLLNLDFGLELASAGLSPQDEQALSTQGRDALIVARALRARRHEPGEGSELTPSSPALSPWLVFGLELASLGLDEAEEEELSDQGRDALVAARALRARDGLAEGPEAAASTRSRQWLSIGLELDAADVSEAAEEQLSCFARDALAVVRVLRARDSAELLEGSHGAPSSPNRSEWINFGLALEATGLSEEEELGLSSFARDALLAARALRARDRNSLDEGCEAVLSAADQAWIQLGFELDAADLSEDEEATLSNFAMDAMAAARILRSRAEGAELPPSAHGPFPPWVDYGLELAAADLSEEQALALSNFARDTMAFARICLEREGDEISPPRRKLSNLGFGADLDAAGLEDHEEQALSTFAQDALVLARAARSRGVEAGEATPSRRRGWVELGMELEAAGLTDDEEAALSCYARDARAAARLLRAREAFGNALGLEHPGEASPGHQDRRWLEMGLELDHASLTEEEEGGLSAFSHDAMAAARMLRSRGALVEAEEGAPSAGWTALGRELDSSGLSEAEEAGLSCQGRDALVVARVLRAREARDEAAETAPSKPSRRVAPGSHAAPELDETNEAPRSATNRPWLDLGLELAASGLSEACEGALSGPGRDALTAARALRARGGLSEGNEADLSSQRRTADSGMPPEARSEATEAIPSTAKGGRRWLDYGTKLDSRGLTESDEKALTGPSRDALVLARMLGRSEGGEAALSKPARAPTLPPLGMPRGAGQEAGVSRPGDTSRRDFWDSPRSRAALSPREELRPSVASSIATWLKPFNPFGKGDLPPPPEGGEGRASDGIAVDITVSTTSFKPAAPPFKPAPPPPTPRMEAGCVHWEASTSAAPLHRTSTRLSAGQSEEETQTVDPSIQPDQHAVHITPLPHQTDSIPTVPTTATAAAEVAVAAQTAPQDPASTQAELSHQGRIEGTTTTTTEPAAEPPLAVPAPAAQMLVHGGVALTTTADSSHAAPQPAAPADDALGQITTAVASNAAEAVVFEQATDPRAPHFAAQPLGAPPPAAPAAGGPPLPEHATVAMGHLHQTVLELPSSVATPGAADPDAFADSERAALARHLNWALASDEHASASLPIDPSCSAFFGAVANGIVLSKYALRVDSTALDERALNLPGERGQLLGREDMLQNQSLCLNAATAIGCGVPGLTPQQMVDAPPSGQQRALQLVWNMVRSALLNPIQASKNPEIHGMLLAGEDPASLARYRPEKVLQRWVNHHIRGYLEASPEQASVPRTFRVTNLHADLADGLALSIVLHQVAPRRSAAEGVSEAALASSSADERVRLAIEAAELCGVEMFEVDAADVLEARPRMLLAFVAAIFRTCPGLDAQAEPEAPASKRGRRGNRSQEREEAALRMWMASLGLGLESLSSLYEDCRTGVVFLRLLDFLRPGAVDWSRVLLQPRSIYERVQNCNRAVSVARQVGLVVAGFSGKDLADGISMYILSMASQLMRTHACQFLEALGMGDADMLEWANCQIKRHDEAMPNLRNFADPQIRTGVFLLKLLRSVAPECAREELILSGTTEEERAQNARYAISCAHKAGCTVFATWEDVVEGRPRMMLCLLAAIMAEDLRRHAAEPVDKDLPTPNQS